MTGYAKVWTDGSCNNTASKGMGMGICIRVGGQDPQYYQAYLKDLNGKATSNIAEFLALLHGVTLVVEQDVKYLNIFCDSQVLVRGITGEYDTKNPTLLMIQNRIISLLEEHNIVYTIDWISRKFNKEADQLARQAVLCQQSTSETPKTTT